MKPTAILKIIVDIVMTVLLMLLMAFELVGRSAHEWIGLGMFLLFILHHVLNRRWSRNLFRGRYTPVRILQTACAALVLLSMLGSLISAVPISRVVFSFLPISGGLSFGRTLHMLSAYWGFVLLSLHLGLHWNMLLAMIKKACPELTTAGPFPADMRRLLLRAVGIVIALYGVFAFFRRTIPDYLFLRSHFVFFDFEEPRIFFFLDYLAIMGLFIFIGHYLMKAALWLQVTVHSSARTS